MCAHANNTNESIELLVQNLYPAIQHQIILCSSCINCISENPNNPNAALYQLLNELKIEFQSLLTYEIKLVFPSIIKVFDKNSKHQNSSAPSIEDLLHLTQSKEQKIIELASDMKIQISISDFSDMDSSVCKLIELFINDFAIEKTKWNNMIQARLLSCACFATKYS